MNSLRKSAVLLHPTSLPGRFGIGTLGAESYAFVDFLIEAKQQIWQVLPLGPTGYGDCPYSAFSAFAGNPYLIDLDVLIEESLLMEQECDVLLGLSEVKVDFGGIYENKIPVLRSAFARFKERGHNSLYNDFCWIHGYWLEDYALYAAIKSHNGGKPWFEWEDGLKFRDAAILDQYRHMLEDEMHFQRFMQFKFFEQWHRVKGYANANGIQIIGDIPMYVALDSCDSWAHPEVFYFDCELNPVRVSGVPPDYFSETGQLWGNPVFRWDYLKATGYSWWMDRIKINRELYDIIRFDHFRAFAAFWSVPYGETTAMNGEWVAANGVELFDQILQTYPDIDIIAEDLGLITDDVRELIARYDFTCMKILQFAFDTDETSTGFLPHGYKENTIVYTGALDNDTVRGWYDHAKPADQKYLRDYVRTTSKGLVWDMIKAASGSVSRYAATTMQDLLGLGSEARMNTPGVATGNWSWRYSKEMLTPEITKKLRHITQLYERA